jgi:ABC-type lipoprotein release transport system permease subunit
MNMSFFRFLYRSLIFHRGSHAAVAATVAVATAVLCGAMFVGDSLQGSLRSLALDRLQRIDDVLLSDHFFREALAEETRQQPEFEKTFAQLVPGLLLESSLETAPQNGQKPFRLGQVQTIGCGADFWQLENLSSATPKDAPGPDEVWLGAFTANELRITVGDEIILRIGAASDIPVDSPLGKKTETSRSRRLKLARILPNRGLATFSLKATQQQTPAAFVATATLQSMLDQPGKINALFAARKAIGSGQAQPSLQAFIKPKLSDLGLVVTESPLGFVQITSDRMMMDRDQIRIPQLASKQQTVLTYLSNWLEVVKPDSDHPCRIPYATVSAINLVSASWLPQGITTTGNDKLPEIDDGTILLSSEAASDFLAQGHQLKLGDPIKLTYFEPESTHGEVRETAATFTLAGIVPVAGWAADPLLTPELKGVTDQASIANWDPPFPYDPKRVRTAPPHDQDDAYWKKYKALPRAFVSLADGARLWGSRWGSVTAFRVKLNEGASLDAFRQSLAVANTAACLKKNVIPLRPNLLSAANGSTPFGILFFAFSFFLMVAALLLVAIVFRLMVDQRAKEVGLLQALGVSPRRVLWQRLVEGACVAVVGATFGILLGIGYAALMIAGLNSPWFWQAAIGRSFLTLFVRPESCIMGWLLGLVVSVIAMILSVRRLRDWPVTQLLAGQVESARGAAKASVWPKVTALLCSVAALGIAALAPSGGEAQAGAFFTSGGLLLTALLLWHHQSLQKPAHGLTSFSLLGLAARSTQRNPVRSTLTIGLVAAATFLIVAVSSFNLDAARGAQDKTSGAGGFSLIAETSQPIYVDLNSPAARSDLGFSPQAESVSARCRIYSLRASSGDDASCLNLFQAQAPRELALGDDFIERGGFAWDGMLKLKDSLANDAVADNLWKTLSDPAYLSAFRAEFHTSDCVPIVLDANTAQYALHWEYGPLAPRGSSLDFPAAVVGLLKDSILQGNILRSESGYVHHASAKPDGYRIFLIDCPGSTTADVANLKTTLEESLSDYGFHATPCAERLASIMNVQNTYLSTFQTLGGLGLLLGTLGLAVVELRSIWERRGELALLQATGWKTSRLCWLVLLEHTYLLIAGLGIGLVAALVAILPHLREGLSGLPLARLALTLSAVLGCGLAAGLLAVRFTAKVPLIATLREAK